MDLKLKPNVLLDVSRQHTLGLATLKDTYYSEDAAVWIEDDSGRIQLTGPWMQSTQLVTGIVVAVLGKMVGTAFHVDDACFAGLPPQLPRTPSPPEQYVALVSGLEVGRPQGRTMSTHLLVDYLSGVFGSSNIARVIVAGNAFGNGKRRMFDKHAQTDALRQRNVQAAQRVDTMLTELGATVQVDLMPGEQDPAMLSLPQQPFFHGLLPNASQHASLRRVTNPYACTIDNTLFLGTSGQNVDDAYRYIAPVKRDRMSLAADMLQWRHMAPTAPDTLYAYPYVDKDPFIMEHCPHVYFIGNQPQFETTTIVGDHGQSVRVVLVPKFSTSGTVVLVNLSTLACTSVRIGSQLPQDAMQVGEEDNVEEEEEVDVVIDHEGGDDDE